VSYFMRTIQNPRHRKDLFDRLARLDPAQPPLWGRLTAPKMLAHLCDQMRMPYNDNPSPPIPGVQHYPVMRQFVLYLLPWPKAQIQGPPEATSRTGTSTTICGSSVREVARPDEPPTNALPVGVPLSLR